MHRLLIAAAVWCFGAGAVELKVDHVTVAGHDLHAMQAAFGAAGIPSEFGGQHTNGMTEMAIASFPDGSYLELMAAQPGASAAKHYWGKFIEQDAGVCAWAAPVQDLKAEAARWKSKGVVGAPAQGGRQRPDGVGLRWISAGAGPGPQGSFFPFFIQDETPRQSRVYPHGAPSVTGMEGIALVVVAVRNLDSAIQRWREMFALGEPRRQDDAGLSAHLAWFAGTPVVLAAAIEPGSPVARRLEQFGEAPFAVVLRAKRLPAKAKTAPTKWFGNSIAWFDTKALKGARIAAMAGGND